MRCLRVELFGNNAHIKDVRANIGELGECYGTFPHIHKPMILGILGAILGLDGKNQQLKNNGKFEYYEKLKELKISIEPKQVTFSKYLDTITNTTGFANKGGETQVVTLEVLINPKWNIYIQEGAYYEELKEALMIKRESKYPLYLGSNRFKAQIGQVEEINIEEIKEIEEVFCIDSIFSKKIVEDLKEESLEGKDYDLLINIPVSLNEFGLYNYEMSLFSNLDLEVNSTKGLFENDEKTLYFY